MLLVVVDGEQRGNLQPLCGKEPGVFEKGTILGHIVVVNTNEGAVVVENETVIAPVRPGLRQRHARHRLASGIFRGHPAQHGDGGFGHDGLRFNG